MEQSLLAEEAAADSSGQRRLKHLSPLLLVMLLMAIVAPIGLSMHDVEAHHQGRITLTGTV